MPKRFQSFLPTSLITPSKVKDSNSSSNYSCNSITSLGSNIAIHQKQTNQNHNEQNSDYLQTQFISSESSSGYYFNLFFFFAE